MWLIKAVDVYFYGYDEKYGTLFTPRTSEAWQFKTEDLAKQELGYSGIDGTIVKYKV